MRKGPKLFTCPKCRHTYLGHDPVPDCPRCGHDYRGKEGFRWDMLAYVAAILALLSLFLMTTYYRDPVRMPPQSSTTARISRKSCRARVQSRFTILQERGR